MDRGDLQRVFVLAGLLTGLVAIGSMPFYPEWSARYTAVGMLALANWFVLAKMLQAYSENRGVVAAVYALFKPLLLAVLLVLGKTGFIEVSSFLAGLNTFFISLLLYMALRRFFRPLDQAEVAARGLNAHG